MDSVRPDLVLVYDPVAMEDGTVGFNAYFAAVSDDQNLVRITDVREKITRDELIQFLVPEIVNRKPESVGVVIGENAMRLVGKPTLERIKSGEFSADDLIIEVNTHMNKESNHGR